MTRFLIVLQIFLLCFAAISCSQSPGNSSTNTTTNSGTQSAKSCSPISDTPTEAYKRLFEAVKSKNTEKIKAEMSKKTQEFAGSLAERQKKPVAEVFENGFTATTLSPTLPEIRDERIAGCWAGVEVRNEKDSRWEDLPFANEDGAWKLAVGELFSGAFQSPGKGQDQREREAANTARGSVPIAPNPIPENFNGNISNSNVNTNTKMPKYDGPQVGPLPKKK